MNLNNTNNMTLLNPKKSALKKLEAKVNEVMDFSIDTCKDDEDLYKEVSEDWDQHLVTIKRFIIYCDRKYSAKFIMDQTYRNQDVVKLFNEFLKENIDKKRPQLKVVK